LLHNISPLERGRADLCSGRVCLWSRRTHPSTPLERGRADLCSGRVCLWSRRTHPSTPLKRGIAPSFALFPYSQHL